MAQLYTPEQYHKEFPVAGRHLLPKCPKPDYFLVGCIDYPVLEVYVSKTHVTVSDLDDTSFTLNVESRHEARKVLDKLGALTHFLNPSVRTHRMSPELIAMGFQIW